MTTTTPTIDDILADFELLDDWEDRYRYVIELGKELPPLPPEDHTEANKVHGCVSQVWLKVDPRADEADPSLTRLYYKGDSDAMIVKGLIAILLALYSGKTKDEILAINAEDMLARLGLQEHLTPQRSNGLASMVNRIRTDAARL